MKARRLQELILLFFSSFLSNVVLDAFVIPKPAVSSTRRSPTVLSMEAGSSTSALEVFLVTTGLRNIIPHLPSSLQQQQLPGTTATTTSATNLLVYAPLILGLGVFLLFLVGIFVFSAWGFVFFAPIFEYAMASSPENNEKLNALGNELFSKLNDSYQKMEKRSLDQGYRVLSENKQDLEFVRICVDRLVEWEKFVCEVAYVFGFYVEETEQALQSLQSTAMQEFVVKELIPILQQDYPEKWRDFEQDFSAETGKCFESMVFVAYLIEMEEGKDASIVKRIFSKSSYDDFVDCAMQSYQLSSTKSPTAVGMDESSATTSSR